MSRIGKKSVQIPEGVAMQINDSQITISGPKGSISIALKKGIEIKTDNNEIFVTRRGDSKQLRALHGTVRATLANMIKGVTLGFEKTLVLHGVGFRARIEEDALYISVGFSHPVKVTPPTGIKFSTIEDKIIVSGIDKKLVGETADKIRRIKPPEPYKGKGIRYSTERVRRKAGKKAVATA